MVADVYRAAGELMRTPASWPASPTRAAGGRTSRATRTRSTSLVRAIERAGLRPGDDVAIALDIAASEFGRDGRYRLGARGPRRSTATRWPNCCCAGSIATRSCRSRIRSPRTTRRLDRASRARAGDRVQIVGDDYLVTQRGAGRRAPPSTRACNAVLIKPNQAGTLTETRGRAGRRARAPASATIVSARSGETEDVVDRAPRGRLERRPAQGRLVRARRAHGQVERGAAHRGGARRGGALRRRRRAGGYAPLSVRRRPNFRVVRAVGAGQCRDGRAARRPARERRRLRCDVLCAMRQARRRRCTILYPLRRDDRAAADAPAGRARSDALATAARHLPPSTSAAAHIRSAAAGGTLRHRRRDAAAGRGRARPHRARQGHPADAAHRMAGHQCRAAQRARHLARLRRAARGDRRHRVVHRQHADRHHACRCSARSRVPIVDGRWSARSCTTR